MRRGGHNEVFLGFGNCFLMPHGTIYEETDWPTGLCGTVFTPAQLGSCRLTAAQFLSKRGGFQFALWVNQNHQQS